MKKPHYAEALSTTSLGVELDAVIGGADPGDVANCAGAVVTGVAATVGATLVNPGLGAITAVGAGMQIGGACVDLVVTPNDR